jgi:hypothetical protein
MTRTVNAAEILLNIGFIFSPRKILSSYGLDLAGPFNRTSVEKILKGD